MHKIHEALVMEGFRDDGYDAEKFFSLEGVEYWHTKNNCRVSIFQNKEGSLTIISSWKNLGGDGDATYGDTEKILQFINSKLGK